MKRIALNKYLKKLVIFLITCVLLIAFFKIISLLFFKTNNKIDKELQDVTDRNKSVFQNKVLSNTEIEKINEFINSFVQACNEKEYNKIWTFLNNEYIDRFNFTKNDVVSFCNLNFNKKRTFDYQNLSIIGNTAIYNLNLYDDIMATGVNSMDDYKANSLIVVIKKMPNNEYKISLDEYIETVSYEKVFENETCCIKILKKDVYYEKENYFIQIKNKDLNNYIFLSNNYDLSNIELISEQNNKSTKFICKTTLNPFIQNLIIQPNSTKDFELLFSKYFDISQYVSSNRITFKNLTIMPYTQYKEINNINDFKNNQNVFDIEINI